MPVDIGSLIANGGKAAASSSGGWGDILEWLVPAGASLAGGWLSGQAGEASANAERDAAEASAQLQRDVYYDQRGLARPGYVTGGAAANILASQFGIAPQSYEAAFDNGSNGGMSGGNAMLPNFGAGQPVAGHSGGGGPNALAAGAGTIAGSFFGPVGSAVGGVLGGLVRSGGDNWKTLATQAPEGYDYDKFWNDNPDLQVDPKGWQKADVRALFNNNRNAYLNWFQNQSPDRKISLLDGYQAGANGIPIRAAAPASTGSATGSTANALANPMAGFMSSPYGKIATSGFRGVDTPEVNSAYARGGKALSGAQSIALDERGKARLGGAYTDYTNGLRSLAGMNQTASSQASSAAGQYGVNAGNATMAAGQAKGNALASAYGGLAQGVSGALGTIRDYGRKQWGWA